MNENINREITQLKSDDVFLIIDRVKQKFDFPIHFHPEYELNFILNGKGVRRIVGTSMEDIEDIELVLVGPNLEHGWETHNCTSENIYEITIQFHQHLFHNTLLSLKNFKPIKDMFNRSKHGILFDDNTAIKLMPRIKGLISTDGITDFIQLLKLLEELAGSKSQRLLSQNVVRDNEYANSSRIRQVQEFVKQNHA